MRQAPRINAHKTVAALAVEMAQQVFEESMSRDNDLYRGLKASNPGATTNQIRRWFVQQLAPQMVEVARKQLASMLGNPNIDEPTKQKIYEAVLADSAFARGHSVH